MYSPKIRDDLIPKLYQEAKAKRIPMTDLVNRILEQVLNGNKGITQKTEIKGEEAGHETTIIN